MRVASVGIFFPARPVEALVDAVFQSGHVTHNTTIGLAGASAVAAAVSAAIDGATIDEALQAAVEGARQGAKRGFYFAGGDIAGNCKGDKCTMRLRDEPDVTEGLTQTEYSP